MTTDEVLDLTGRYLLPTYRRAPVAFASGQGVWLYDLEGRRYLDFIGGIAVCALGHNHPALVAAVADQAARVIHVSNLFHIAEQARLAQWLVEHSAFDRVWFCNSGAEANEAAIKLARKWGRRGERHRYEIIVAHQSFHGRTMGTLAATMQPKYQEPFAPLLPGFVAVPFNDPDALAGATTERTVAVMLEPVQGESGVVPADPAYLQAAREWCTANDLLLILDEVQTGMGRTGTLFAYEQYGIVPDMMTLAKGLGGGVPIGALLVREHCAALGAGDHGSTFGGNPLACAAALAVAQTIVAARLPERAGTLGRYFAAGLQRLVDRGLARAVRGRGLLLALELGTDAALVVDRCRAEGLLANAVQAQTLRFAPPLIVSEEEIDQALAVLERVLAAVVAAPGPVGTT
ncbi:MAG: acetylornithine transaminase [Armatimonadota bacterium]|nr:acetylornithine transaminase [Armatimonadota bacterium]MDR7533325.1 acetylornithine transaminase [Armatimonadota bacterium]MDR7536556.1 acetylornithine transaminase [Armatimonadota bacterium]